MLALGVLGGVGAWTEFSLPALFVRDAAMLAPTVSLGFVLVGIVLLVEVPKPESTAPLPGVLGQFLGTALFLLGAAVLLQNLLGIDLRIDDLLSGRGASAGARDASGRMSPVSAASFILLGVSILGQRLALLAQLAAGVVGLVGSVVFATYLYGLESVSRVASIETMPFQASLGFLIAALGAFFLRFDAGLAAILLDRSEPARQLRLFLPVAIVLPLALGTIAIAGGRASLWRPEYDAVVLSVAMIAALILFAVLSFLSFRSSDRERLDAVRSLSASEERYRRTFEHATVGIAHLAADGRWIRVNDRTCEILGYSSEELLSMRYAEVSHLDDIDIDARQWELLRRGEIDDYGVERRLITKQGDQIFADVRLVRESDEEGDLQHLIMVLQDITGRKQSVATLRVSQRALAATQNGILICDATQDDTPIIYTNPAFLQSTGFDEAEVIGKNCRFLNRHARDQAALGVLREALEAGEECSVLLRNHRKDDSPYWNQLSIAPVHDDQGRLTHFVGISVDVTDRVESIAERESLLKGAEEANAEKDRFLSVVSHEMRSPMNAILAWASILAEDSEDEEVVRAAEAITASVQSQSRLVDDLLEVSRMRAGTLEVDPTELEIVAVIDSVVEQMSPIAVERGIALEWQCPDVPVLGWADPERLSQVIRNLIDNALKFTPSGGRIDVILDASKAAIEIEVRDSGRGLSPQSLERIFDNFWQGDRSAGGTGSGGKGLGLGLPIVRYLVERQGGKIIAESEGEGQGATFRVTLPRSAGAAAEPRADTRAETAPGESSAGGVGVEGGIGAGRSNARPSANEGAGRRGHADLSVLSGLEIVVVDDDVPTVDATAAALEQVDVVVHRAYTVAQALRHFDERQPDLLISDIGLPDRDGTELIAMLRRRDTASRTIPALAVTGFAGIAEQRRIQRAGFDGTLTKPVLPAVILDRAAELLTRLRATRAEARRVLLIRGPASGLHSLAGVIEAEGHDFCELDTPQAFLETARAFEPEVVLVGTALGEIDASHVAGRLRAARVGRVCVVIRDGPEGPLETTHFDFQLDYPGCEPALRRLLRLIEVSK